MMKKLALTLVMAVIMVAAVASTAMAVEPYYHGDFADNSLGCAKCHVTHAGQAAALLISGPTQTDFCYYCHNSLSKSPYDAKNGMIATPAAGGFMPSVAGGFYKTFDFDNHNYASHAYTLTDYVYSTSVHGVETYDGDVWDETSIIPGGTTTLTGDFRCGSCHDPHKGGNYATSTIMPRLLRLDLPKLVQEATDNGGVGESVYDHRDWTFGSIGASDTTGFKTQVVTGYGDNVGIWCAGCHDLFNQMDADAGQAAVSDGGTSVSNKYMHRMNFTLDNPTDVTHQSLEKVALSVNDKLVCLTCHRAHGTGSSTSDTVWTRASASYELSDGSTDDESDSSVLLRETNRDVCYDCHGAAEFNKPSDQS